MSEKTTFSSNKKKYYLITCLSSFLISLYLGIRFKVPKAEVFAYLSKSSSKWQRDNNLEFLRKSSSSLDLDFFVFNWELFIISLLIFVFVIVFVGKTVYYDKLTDYFKRIQKK